MKPEEEWHRRQAVQLASMLPPESDDALVVLASAKRLFETFVMDKAPPADPCRVVPLHRVP